MNITNFEWHPARGWTTPSLGADDSPSTLVVAFGSGARVLSDGAVSQLVAAYPTSHLLVCSTCTPISGDETLDDGLSVAIARFTQTTLRSAWVSTTGGDRTFDDARALAQQLAGPDLRAVLLLSDGQSVNGSALVAGLKDALPDDVVLAGGLAGDGAAFRDTWVVGNGVAGAGIISAVGLYGTALRIGHGLGGGWTSYGPERRVTRSIGNILFELDGRPALSVYRDYLGDLAASLPASALRVPLAVRSAEGGEELVRTILAIDDEAGTMTFAGDVPEGSRARLMTAVLDELVAGAAQAAATAEAVAVPTGPTLALVVSCVGRRIIMGERVEDELLACRETLPDATVQVGFYSHGEIAPGDSGFCALHNQTLTLTTLSEHLA